MTIALILSLVGLASFPLYCTSSRLAGGAAADATSYKHEQVLSEYGGGFSPAEDFEHEINSESIERQMCLAQAQMDENVFPPEQFSDYAIRMVFPAVLFAGDTFFAAKSIEIVRGSFSLDFRRIDDSTFHFDLYGEGVDEHEKNLAEFGVFLRGVKFYTSSGLDSIMKFTHATGSLLKNMFTLGLYNVFVDKEHVSLENIPVSVNTRFSGDIRLTDCGQWKIVPESRSQYAHVVLNKKGVLWHLYNALIRKVGGMDAILFDYIWPVVENLVPAAMGEAFQQLPFEEGQFSEELQVTLVCSGDLGSVGQACEGNGLKVSVKSTTSMKMDPRPVLNKLHELDYFTTSTSIVQSMLDSYEKGNSVLKGARVGLLVDTEVKSNKELVISTSPRMNTPMSLFTSIVGPSVPVANFVPQKGAPLMVGGGLTARDGVAAMKDFRLQGATLPVGTENTAFVSVDLVAGLQVELEDAGGNPSFENHAVFGQSRVERCRSLLHKARDSLSDKESCAATRSRLESARGEVMLLNPPETLAKALNKAHVESNSSCWIIVRTLLETFDDALKAELPADGHPQGSQLNVDMPIFLASLGMASGFTLNPLRTNYEVGDRVMVLGTKGAWRPGTVTDVKSGDTFVVKSTCLHGDDLEEGTYTPGQMEPIDIDYAGTLYGRANGRVVETELRLEGGRLVVGGQDEGPARLATNTTNDAVTIKAGDWVLHGKVDERRRLNGEAEKGGINQGKFALPGKPVVAVKFGPQFLSDILLDYGMSLPGDPTNTRDADAAIGEADGPVPLKFAQPLAKMPPRGLDLNEMVRTGTFEVGVEVSPVENNTKEHVQSTLTVEGELELAMSTHVYSTFIDNTVPDLGYMHYMVGGVLQYGSSQTPCIIYLSCGFLRIYRGVVGDDPFGADVLFSHNLQNGIGKDDWDGPVDFVETHFRSEPKLRKDQFRCIRVGKTKKFWSSHDHYFCAEKTSIEDLAEAVDTQVKRFKDAKRRSSSCTPGPDGTAPVCSHASDGTWFKTWNPLDPQTWFPLLKTRGDIKVASPQQEWSEALKAIDDPHASWR